MPHYLSGEHVRIPLALLRDPHVSQAALAVYATLASFADNTTGKCWPSLATIARQSNVHRTTVFRSLDVLESRGYLTRTKRREAKAGNRPTSTLYRLSSCAPATAPKRAPATVIGFPEQPTEADRSEVQQGLAELSAAMRDGRFGRTS